MVKQGKPCAWVISLLCWTFMAPGADARSVKTLKILQSGLIAKGRIFPMEERVCESFRPRQNKVVEFFNRAQPVADFGTLVHERYSPCSAEGLISFADGSSGEWVLQSSGIATVFFAEGQYIHLYYKTNRWHDPYACMYGLSDEGEC